MPLPPGTKTFGRRAPGLDHREASVQQISTLVKGRSSTAPPAICCQDGSVIYFSAYSLHHRLLPHAQSVQVQGLSLPRRYPLAVSTKLEKSARKHPASHRFMHSLSTSECRSTCELPLSFLAVYVLSLAKIYTFLWQGKHVRKALNGRPTRLYCIPLSSTCAGPSWRLRASGWVDRTGIWWSWSMRRSAIIKDKGSRRPDGKFEPSRGSEIRKRRRTPTTSGTTASSVYGNSPTTTRWSSSTPTYSSSATSTSYSPCRRSLPLGTTPRCSTPEWWCWSPPTAPSIFWWVTRRRSSPTTAATRVTLTRSSPGGIASPEGWIFSSISGPGTTRRRSRPRSGFSAPTRRFSTFCITWAWSPGSASGTSTATGMWTFSRNLPTTWRTRGGGEFTTPWRGSSRVSVCCGRRRRRR